MECHITNEHLFSAACLVFMFCGLFSCIIRWNHMCRPFNENDKFFYPGRRQVSFFVAATMLQFPYVLNPFDPGCWMFIRVFGILFYPLCFSMMFRRYFRDKRLENSYMYKVLFNFTFIVIFLMLLAVLAGWALLLRIMSHPVFLIAMSLFSMSLSVGYVNEVRRIKRLFKSINEGTYSNEEDFPYVFARRVYLLPVIWLIFMWAIFITGNHWVKVVSDIVCTSLMISFILTILHPQEPFLTAERKERFHMAWQQIHQLVGEFIDNGAMSDDSSVENINSGCDTDIDTVGVPTDVRREVMAVISHRFKDSHLLKGDVMSAISAGNKKKANQFIISMGYYNLVNAVRLKYSRCYLERHPRVTKDELAEVSGFSSRFSMIHVEKRGITIDEHLLDDISFDDM